MKGYDHKLYLYNCRKMIRLNKEQVDEFLDLYNEETDPQNKLELKRELEGWSRWVKIWEERLEAALQVQTQ